MEMLTFVITHNKSPTIGPRIGKLCLSSGNRIQTPHYVATTSRGSVPHITPDLLKRHTKINSVYLALEDFIEKSASEKLPIFACHTSEDENKLRHFTGLQDDMLLILGPRRVPSVPCPAPNTNSSISILPSPGFQQLGLDSYNEALQILRPDIAVVLADIVDSDRPSRKRIEKSADRTHAWLRDTLTVRDYKDWGSSCAPLALFASIPPLDSKQQSFYIDDLANDFRPSVSGLATATPSSNTVIPSQCSALPRLCLDDPPTPHAVLKAIFLGTDLITLPFVNSCSEAGQAFTFTFPSPHSPSPLITSSTKLPLAIDLWSPAQYSTSLSPILPFCSCHTCTSHHLAYIVHLLDAKEMLAWTLLQIHNHATIETFFKSVRASIDAGTFDSDVETFMRTYEAEMPIQTGNGPRVRGYQANSVGRGEPRRNPKAYGTLDERAEVLNETKRTDGVIGQPGLEGEEIRDKCPSNTADLVHRLEGSGLVKRA